MPFCPQCACDYPTGSECSKHGGLIVSMPGMTRDKDDQFIRLATTWSEVIAQSWAEVLRNNSIPTVVKVGGPGFSFGAPPAFGYATYVYVPEYLFKRGRFILEGYEEPGVLKLEPLAVDDAS